MLTNEQFHDLAVGDVVELPALLAGVTDEPVLLAVAATVALGGAVALQLDATYFGVPCGTWLAEQSNPGEPITWRRK